jgi:glycosyltransferase involved in cell wall biosynthesis
MIGADRIYEVFYHAHFLIIPSRFDSIPVILSDALQCNTPVIGSDIGDLGDIIKKYGIGYTFEKENLAQLCNCIIKAFKDDKNDYYKNCREAVKIFSVDYAVSEFLKNI